MKLKRMLKTTCALVLLCAISITSLFGCQMFKSEEQKQPSATPTSTPTLKIQTLTADEGLDLGVSTYATNKTGCTLEKSVTATISPAGAEGASKGVTWALTWQDGTTDGLSSCLKIVSEGLTCYVGCSAKFTKTALLTCTSVVGNCKAYCTITYLGAPTSLNADMSNVGTAATDSAWGNSYYKVYAGKTYTIPLQVKDVFGNNLSNCEDGWSIESITVNGTANYNNQIQGDKVATIRQHDTTTHPILITRKIVTKVGAVLTEATSDLSASYNDLFSCNTSENPGNLVIKVTASCESIELMPCVSGFITYKTTFKNYANSKPVYFTINLKEITSGLTKSISIRPYSDVTAVTLSASTLSF